jgi:hypothetical protein
MQFVTVWIQTLSRDTLENHESILGYVCRRRCRLSVVENIIKHANTHHTTHTHTRTHTHIYLPTHTTIPKTNIQPISWLLPTNFSLRLISLWMLHSIGQDVRPGQASSRSFELLLVLFSRMTNFTGTWQYYHQPRRLYRLPTSMATKKKITTSYLSALFGMVWDDVVRHSILCQLLSLSLTLTYHRHQTTCRPSFLPTFLACKKCFPDFWSSE